MSSSKVIFVVWQDPVDRSWHPVAKLTGENDFYAFQYTKGATSSERFVPFGRLKSLDRIYRTKDLFPLFKNRLLDEGRPEYPDYLRWLNLEFTDPLEILDRTEGLRKTDSLAMFAAPQADEDGYYRGFFFSHGVRHLPEASQNRILALEKGEPLFAMRDDQNAVDPNALALRTEPPIIVGYVPRFRAEDFRELLARQETQEDVQFWVERVNRDAPSQFRLLCGVKVKWPQNFTACSQVEFQPIVEGFDKAVAWASDSESRL